MKLSDIKQFAKKRAKAKNATGTPSKSVYGGVGMVGIPHDPTPPESAPVGDGGGGSGGD